MLSENRLFLGDVYHARHDPFFHDFKYRVYSVFVDVDDLDASAKTPKYFSFNKFNLLSLHLKNHGCRDGSPLRPWIERAANEKNINIDGGKIYMLTFPRVLGYVFSPLTVYFCYNRKKELIALLYQVKNTFGEQHGYLLATERGSKSGIIKQDTAKVFHVSPFIEMDCHYSFRVSEPNETGFHVAIHQTTANGKILTATWDGTHALAFTLGNFLKVFFTVPLMTVKIIVAIHWQALKLWIKGASFRKSPNPPEKDIS